MKVVNVKTELDLYKILKIEPTADAISIRRAYKFAALSTHPDKAGGSNESFHHVNFAFEVLSCPLARQQYDRSKDIHCVIAAFGNDHAQGRTQRASDTNAEFETAAVGNNNLKGQKRRRAFNTNADIPSAKKSRVASAFDSLRCVLSAMEAEQRRASILQMSVNIRKKFLAHMEDVELCQGAKQRSGRGLQNRTAPQTLPRHPNQCGWVVKATHHPMYKARVNFLSLVMYTRWQNTLETAVEYQILLTRIRNAVVLEAMNVDLEVARVQQIYQSILVDSDIDEKEIGLRAHVTVRGFGCRVLSPAFALGEAWQVRRRLLHARSTSWKSFRDEWVSLLCTGRNPLTQMLAMDVADAARRSALEEDLKRAICRVDVAVRV